MVLAAGGAVAVGAAASPGTNLAAAGAIVLMNLKAGVRAAGVCGSSPVAAAGEAPLRHVGLKISCLLCARVRMVAVSSTRTEGSLCTR